MTNPDELPLWFAIPAIIILWGILIYLWLRDRRKLKRLRWILHSGVTLVDVGSMYPQEYRDPTAETEAKHLIKLHQNSEYGKTLVVKGGTGATTTKQARENLGLFDQDGETDESK